MRLKIKNGEVQLTPEFLQKVGDIRKDSDIYLFVAGQLGGELEATVRATGYDPFNPTKESVSKAKKEAKRARSIAKVLHLSSGYGAGPGKIRQTLGLSGIELSMEQTKAMHRQYWEIFAGVKKYEREMLAQWEKTGGWVINPLGRPVAVAQDYVKDLVNRLVQSSGHDCFMWLTRLVAEELTSAGISYQPYIWDIHDCVMFTVPEEAAHRTKELLDGVVMRRLNELMNGPVTFKAEANLVNNFWEDKAE